MTNSVFILMSLFLLPVFIFLRGLTIALLWQWFISPTFNLPLLSIPVAYGLALISSFLTHPLRLNEYTEKERLTVFIYGFINPLITMGIGYIVYLFI